VKPVHEIEPFVFSDAVREFWATRDKQIADQELRGASDQGARGAVTGGQQMDGFIRKIIRLMMGAGVNPEYIYTQKRQLHLPGFFRPTKQWDLLVVETGELKAALELKSQVGPSFGNNFNNRTEEAMGSAVDIWTAFREGAFRLSPQPWLGYLFLLEDCPGSQRPVSVYEPHFPVFEEFKGASYARRYELFCRKLVRERKYTAACFIRADRNRAHLRDNYLEPAEDLSAAGFLLQLLRHVGSP
jgi:hypothetical protein